MFAMFPVAGAENEERVARIGPDFGTRIGAKWVVVVVVVVTTVVV